MTLRIAPVNQGFVAAVSGIDLRRPVERDDFLRIEAALDLYAVLIFKDQPLDDSQQIEFSSLFGPVEMSIGAIRANRKTRLRSEVADISNLDIHNNIRPAGDQWRLMQLANQLWHTDSSFKPIPGKISFLSAREVPPKGGETEFADLRAAHDSLDTATAEVIKDLFAEHSIFFSRSLVGYADFSPEERAALPPVARPLVRTIVGSGRQTLYLASHASHIVGWPIQQGRELLERLTAAATEPRFVFSHRWSPGDLLAWDNRCTMHRGRPFDAGHRRDLRRITVSDANPRNNPASVGDRAIESKTRGDQ